MSLMSTVNPPLTLPLMIPVTVSSSSNADSRRLHALARFRLLAGELGGAESVLDGIERDLDTVADRDLQLAVLVSELVDRNGRLGFSVPREP